VSTGLVRSLVPHLHRRGPNVSSAIYGTVSTLAVIVVAGHDDAPVGRVLLLASVSAVVVWGIHVYASVLSDICLQRMPWKLAIPRGFREELGVLEGASAPLLVLALGALGVLDPERAKWWSVLLGVGLLTAMPLYWLRRNGEPWGRCLAASAVALGFGLVLVVLKVLAH
jgi:hypothetical protein